MQAIIQNGMYKVLEHLYHKNQSKKFDIHYEDGKGAIVVPHEYPLEQKFVVAKISENDLRMIGLGIAKL